MQLARLAQNTVMGRAFLETFAYITHISTLTHTQTHLSKGAVVDNSLCSTPDASAGIVAHHAETAAETFYGPCFPTADLGWASPLPDLDLL